MPADERNIVHQRVFAGHPLGGHGPLVVAAVQADAGDDVRAALGRLEQRLGGPSPLKPAVPSFKRICVANGLRPMSTCRAQGERVAHQISPGGQVDAPVGGNGLL